MVAELMGGSFGGLVLILNQFTYNCYYRNVLFGTLEHNVKKVPVDQLKQNKDKHLGVIIAGMMAQVLRPFLEDWQVNYRYWWEHKSNPRLAPLERQAEFPELAAFQKDWSSVRWLLRQLQKERVTTYELVDVSVEKITLIHHLKVCTLLKSQRCQQQKNIDWQRFSLVRITTGKAYSKYLIVTLNTINDFDDFSG
jgi:hypothetical protein